MRLQNNKIKATLSWNALPLHQKDSVVVPRATDKEASIPPLRGFPGPSHKGTSTTCWRAIYDPSGLWMPWIHQNKQKIVIRQRNVWICENATPTVWSLIEIIGWMNSKCYFDMRKKTGSKCRICSSPKLHQFDRNYINIDKKISRSQYSACILLEKPLKHNQGISVYQKSCLNTLSTQNHSFWKMNNWKTNQARFIQHIKGKDPHKSKDTIGTVLYSIIWTIWQQKMEVQVKDHKVRLKDLSRHIITGSNTHSFTLGAQNLLSFSSSSCSSSSLPPHHSSLPTSMSDGCIHSKISVQTTKVIYDSLITHWNSSNEFSTL